LGFGHVHGAYFIRKSGIFNKAEKFETVRHMSFTALGAKEEDDSEQEL
jgi:hypothetical protein